MIAAVRGILEAKGKDWVRVAVGGISLHINMPSVDINELNDVGQQVSLHTLLQLRNSEELVLYGFSQPNGLRLFQMLNTVSGVGPRTALGLLSTMRPEELASAIASGNKDALKRVPGIGEKSASRILLELKSKLEKEVAQVGAPQTSGDGEVVSALVALGYTPTEARQAVVKLSSDNRSRPLEERVREALQGLNK
jgi:Holliday junction DNA helicase RuvA